MNASMHVIYFSFNWENFEPSLYITTSIASILMHIIVASTYLIDGGLVILVMASTTYD
jgi:type III secretory pathway component EscT